MSSLYKSLVFDLDGTAVDTAHNMDALREAYELFSGISLSKEELVICYGLPEKETILFLGLSGSAEKKFTALLKTVFEKYHHLDHLFDGFYNTVKTLKENGIILGINTSRTQTEIDILQRFIPEDLPTLCDVVVSCDKIAHPKPAPDSLIYFMEQANLSGSEILYLGDSIFDSQCAANSGVDFALAMWGTTRPEISALHRPAKPKDLLKLFF